MLTHSREVDIFQQETANPNALMISLAPRICQCDLSPARSGLVGETVAQRGREASVRVPRIVAQGLI
jgi:hypothetical protein